MTLWRRGDGGPKGGKTRVVDLIPFDGYAHLRSLPAYAKSDLVSWHGDGEDYKNLASNFAAVVRRTATWAKANGIAFRPFRFHDLRHCHAVEFLIPGGTSMTCRSGWEHQYNYNPLQRNFRRTSRPN